MPSKCHRQFSPRRVGPQLAAPRLFPILPPMKTAALSSVEKLLRQAKRLPAKDRLRLARELGGPKTAGKNGKAKKTKPPTAAQRRAAFDAFMELAGTAHATHPDVSTNKNKHLADAIYEKKFSIK